MQTLSEKYYKYLPTELILTPLKQVFEPSEQIKCLKCDYLL